MTVSILSAVHNEQIHLQEMINSVIQQSHVDWELLFVSDGSTDSTTEIIQQNAESDSRIKLIGDGQKIGKVAAFNQAFAASKGDAIVLLGGDDTLPQDSLAFRVSPILDKSSHPVSSTTYCKLRMMSDDMSIDGTVLPKGQSAARSGGTIAMDRRVANLVFPIPDSLISEDLWLTRSVDAVSENTTEILQVGLNYRVHSGNSNPRGKPYDEMTAAMSARHRAWDELLATDRFRLPDFMREQLIAQRDLENLRKQEAIVSILFYPGASLADRLAYISMSNRFAYALRTKFYAFFSGWRER